jgi:hypothetical protein
MISIRNIAISISWMVLSVPLIYAQEIKPTEARLIHPRSPVIRDLDLQSQRTLSLLLYPTGPALVAPTDVHDFSRYREFQFGMDLAAVAKLTGMESSEAKVIHRRPAVIQELKWLPVLSRSSSPRADAVRDILFSFYNGELFRIVVSYDRYKTEGMTTEDVVEAVSTKYGTATRPAAEISFSSSQVYNDSEVVLARWEDPQYSFNLFRSSYQPTFGLVAFSKRLDALAREAIVEAIHLDEQEAPQREIERQKKADDENRAAQQKARVANKPNFRP